MNRIRKLLFMCLFKNAINCSIDENGLYYLRSYYCQLQLLRNRFPMLLDSECAVRFTWYRMIFPNKLNQYIFRYSILGKMDIREKITHIMIFDLKKVVFYTILEHCIQN
jgi:hypothetical protein